jgi:uncharacterized membrane protein YphA (DoxX/SURF4 family)
MTNLSPSIKSTMRDRYISATLELLRYLVGAIFIWAAIPKISRPFDFLAGVYNYGIVGPKIGLLIAGMLPWCEAIIGCCLLSGLLQAGASAVALVLSMVFVTAQISAIARNLPITCGCFGIDSEVVGAGTLVRSILLLIASLILCLTMKYFPRKAALSV